ncbi:hypothetical protein BFL43_07655 [Williamsia sp. 1135]|nr:hypothetical protein BFL43_07655 [Williamsia sp. 1135]
MVEVPSLPERSSDVVATGTRTRVGGGFNLAAAAARQGISCVYAGTYGVGHYGSIVRAALDAEGISAMGTARSDGDSGFCVVMVEPDAERTFVTVPGVEARTSLDELENLDIRETDLLAVSGYDLLYPISGAALTPWLASGVGAQLIALDPGPLVLEIPQDRLRPVLEQTDIVSLNEREAQLVAGAPGLCGENLVGAVRNVPGFNVSILLVRQGAAGCLVSAPHLIDEVVNIAAPAVTAVDTTGAGDTHTGVLLAELARGESLRAAVKLANHAAAIAVTRPGASTAPRRNEVLRSIDQTS